MIDIVYILGKGSVWKDNELRYSLRSLEQYVTDYRNVFLIGHKPAFLNDQVIHIPYQDIYKNKATNIMAKVNRAAQDKRLSDDFMFWNDDYFALKPFSAVNYPYYYKCDLQHTSMINKGEYKLHVDATLKMLRALNLPYKNFDCHYPIIYNKFKVKNMIKKYDWSTDYGYILRSMYCNHYGIPGEMKLDCKTNAQIARPHLQGVIEKNHFLSIGDNALTSVMQSYIMARWPNKSKYEV